MTNDEKSKRKKRTRGLGKFSDKDEWKHEKKRYPEHHNESWYFNALDINSSTNIITRVGYRLGQNELETMFLIILDNEDDTNNLKYFNRIPINGFPEDNIYGDDNIKYHCIEPMKKWRLTYRDEIFDVDLIFQARYPPYFYMRDEDPKEIIEKYGDILDKLLRVAGNLHYEQGMNVTGIIKIKENNKIIKERQVNSTGHRDHSWGSRDWVLIDSWNWVCCQSDDFTMNFAKASAFGQYFEHGFISTSDGQEKITNVNVVKTEYGFKGDKKVPKSTTFKIKTPSRELTIVSNTWQSTLISRETDQGITEVYEQIVHYNVDGVKGIGISEYMSSAQN